MSKLPIRPPEPMVTPNNSPVITKDAKNFFDSISKTVDGRVTSIEQERSDSQFNTSELEFLKQSNAASLNALKVGATLHALLLGKLLAFTSEINTYLSVSFHSAVTACLLMVIVYMALSANASEFMHAPRLRNNKLIKFTYYTGHISGWIALITSAIAFFSFGIGIGFSF